DDVERHLSEHLARGPGVAALDRLVELTERRSDNDARVVDKRDHPFGEQIRFAHRIAEVSLGIQAAPLRGSSDHEAHQLADTRERFSHTDHHAGVRFKALVRQPDETPRFDLEKPQRIPTGDRIVACKAVLVSEARRLAHRIAREEPSRARVRHTVTRVVEPALLVEANTLEEVRIPHTAQEVRGPKGLVNRPLDHLALRIGERGHVAASVLVVVVRSLSCGRERRRAHLDGLVDADAKDVGRRGAASRIVLFHDPPTVVEVTRDPHDRSRILWIEHRLLHSPIESIVLVRGYRSAVALSRDANETVSVVENIAKRAVVREVSLVVVLASERADLRVFVDRVDGVRGHGANAGSRLLYLPPIPGSVVREEGLLELPAWSASDQT